MPSWLAEIVRAEGGTISFERFMELALYDRERGYYTRNVFKVGRSGDFATATTVSNRLARSIANWLRSEARYLGLSSVNIIELGGGNGNLADQILRKIGSPWQPIHYQIVEISKPLLKVQQRALRARKIHWQESIETALDAAEGKAVIISNEFVDAFPHRRFERTADGWREIVLAFDAGLWCERLVPISSFADSRVFELQCEMGQRVETFGSYRRWLGNVMRHLEVGSILTIDYGGPPTEIYRRKPRGTSRGFFRHTRLQEMEIYLRPGLQDLTADVNFPDLQDWGETVGLETVGFWSQADFIQRWETPGKKPGNAADSYVSDPEGMGGAMKVLHQRHEL